MNDTEYSDYLSALKLLYLSMMERVGLTTPQTQQYMLIYQWPVYLKRYCDKNNRRDASYHVEEMEKFIAIFYTPRVDSKEDTLRRVFTKHGKTYIQAALGTYLQWRKTCPASYTANRWVAMNNFVIETQSIW